MSTDAVATGTIPKLDRKKTIIIGIVELVVLFIIFFRVIPQIGSYEDALTALQAMTWQALVLIGLAVLAYLAWYGLPFVAAVPGLRYWRAQQLNQAAFAISNGVPAGGAFGLGVQYAMLASWQVPPTVSTAGIAAVGVWSIFVTLGMPILGVAAVALSGQAAGDYVQLALIGLAILVAMIVLFALVMRSEAFARRVGGWANHLLGWHMHRLHKDVDFVALTLKFRNDIVGLVVRRWAAITGAQVGVALLQFLILFAALRGVQGDEPVQTSMLLAFGAYAIAQIGIMIPITPGGLGTVDAALVALLQAFGVSAGDATAADLVWRAASFVPQIIIGVVALVAWFRQANRQLAGKTADAPA